MNKAELAKRVSEKMAVSQEEARRFVNAFQDSLTDALKEDETLILQGFGSFCLWEQSERMGRNPRTGESCLIRSRRSAKFKPGKNLLKTLNGRD